MLAFLGASLAWQDGSIHLGHALLAAFGLLLTHISVNTLNDYYDYRSGVDLATKRTPFSGGSGILPAGLLKPKQVLWLGLGSLLLAVPIGVYFTISKGWLLLPLLIAAAACVLLYTPVMLKRPWPEWMAGLGLGILPVMGCYYIQTGVYSWPVLVSSIPSGILVHNLLLLNEFPDTQADRTAGRKTLPITLGKKKASRLYIALTALVYIWILGGVLSGIMPVYAGLALLTLPLAVKVVRAPRAYQNPAELMPLLGNNVLIILLTQVLLGAGYLLNVILKSA